MPMMIVPMPITISDTDLHTTATVAMPHSIPNATVSRM